MDCGNYLKVSQVGEGASEIGAEDFDSGSSEGNNDRRERPTFSPVHKVGSGVGFSISDTSWEDMADEKPEGSKSLLLDKTDSGHESDGFDSDSKEGADDNSEGLKSLPLDKVDTGQVSGSSASSGSDNGGSDGSGSDNNLEEGTEGKNRADK